jgi:hypothetical protein
MNIHFLSILEKIYSSFVDNLLALWIFLKGFLESGPCGSLYGIQAHMA